jgi:hypothetical protein
MNKLLERRNSILGIVNNILGNLTRNSLDTTYTG